MILPAFWAGNAFRAFTQDMIAEQGAWHRAVNGRGTGLGRHTLVLVALESLCAVVIQNTLDTAHKTITDRLGRLRAIFVRFAEAVIRWRLRRAGLRRGFCVWIGVSSTCQGEGACDRKDYETAEEN